MHIQLSFIYVFSCWVLKTNELSKHVNTCCAFQVWDVSAMLVVVSQYKIPHPTYKFQDWVTPLVEYTFPTNRFNMYIGKTYCMLWMYMHTVFNYFFSVPNLFNYLLSACFKDIVFKMFAAVPNRLKYVRMHALETFFFKKISVVRNRFKYVKNHALYTLFSFLSL